MTSDAASELLGCCFQKRRWASYIRKCWWSILSGKAWQVWQWFWSREGKQASVMLLSIIHSWIYSSWFCIGLGAKVPTYSRRKTGELGNCPILFVQLPDYSHRDRRRQVNNTTFAYCCLMKLTEFGWNVVGSGLLKMRSRKTMWWFSCHHRFDPNFLSPLRFPGFRVCFLFLVQQVELYNYSGNDMSKPGEFSSLIQYRSDFLERVEPHGLWWLICSVGFP